MEHKEGNIGKKFQPCRSRENLLYKVKAAEKMLKSGPYAIDVLYLFMLHINGNVEKIKSSLFLGSAQLSRKIMTLKSTIKNFK